MGLKRFKPTSAGRRFMIISDFSDIDKNANPKNLLLLL